MSDAPKPTDRSIDLRLDRLARETAEAMRQRGRSYPVERHLLRLLDHLHDIDQRNAPRMGRDD
jgi:hypothetical protein